jgi:hypothetical protein
MKTLKTEIILGMILRFNLRLGAHSIWSASTSRHIRRKDSGLRAPHSLDTAKEVLGRLSEALDGLQA